MRGCGALAFLEAAVMAVIVVQAAKLEPEIRGLADRAHDPFCLIRFDAGPVHARIDVEEDAEGTPNPLPQLFLILVQNRNANVGKLLCAFPHPARVGSNYRIGNKDVGGAALAAYEQLERGCTLEIADSAINQHAQ